MKFEPRYEISQKLLYNLAEIYRTIGKLEGEALPNPIYTKIKEQVNEKNAHSVAPKNAKNDSTDNKVENYHKALVDINTFKKQNLDIKLVCLTHERLLKDNPNNVPAGRIRNKPTSYQNTKTNQTIYTPPSHKDTKRFLKSLLKYTEINQNMDPLILAGIFHKQFLLISPFEDGNSRAAQILTRILLAQRDFKFFELLSLESRYRKEQEKYFQKVIALGDYYKIRHKLDFTPWLEYFTCLVLSEFENLHKNIEGQKFDKKLKLNKDQEKLLRHIKKHGSINDNEYSQITKRKKSTRVVDYNQLIEMGLIERKGKARQTYYVLKK